MVERTLPPDNFTHELAQDEPYYLDGPQQGRPPDGEFKAGTKVLLESPSGSYSFVTSEDGIHAAVLTSSLKPLEESAESAQSAS
jgi:hypothetical protein